ncbi:cholesterol esterase [Rhizophlyctis rosea]|uniref:Lipase n=1 Tax=Rhizophlyctis rosea TaxID=64517 RepID=A0AAD5SHB8_9FUNG|nr:cholesterol esterase [Rhizophlyctis rosea]
MTSLLNSVFSSFSSWSVSQQPSTSPSLKDTKADSACDLITALIPPLPTEAEAVEAIAKLDTAVELVQFWNYPCETHTVKTADSYILNLHRISNKRGETTAYTAPRPSPKPAVIVWHGLAISSEAWVCCPGGPSRNFAFVLADAGFDVWMANSRGNKYSLDYHHDGKGPVNDFWKFGLDEMANNDVRAVVHYVRAQTGRDKVTYIGYSQGSAIGFAALSMDEELNQHVDMFIAMAPAMRPKPLANAKVSYIVDTFSPDILYKVLGRSSFLPFADAARRVLGPSNNAVLVQGALEGIFGWRCDKWPVRWRPALYSHLFSHASMKCIVHWFQIITTGTFSHYHPGADQSSFVATAAQSSCPPVPYPTRHITTKMHLFAGGRDNISDVDFMRKALPRSAVIDVVQDYEHMDFLWADSAKDLVWDKIVKIIRDLQKSS